MIAPELIGREEAVADRIDPLVSCVMIFFNTERYIAEAIDSILAQSYENWELILVDDGSTDGSSAIAEAYRAADPRRIRYLRHPGNANRGMSASRNLGCWNARGRYIALLDADDVWLPNKLAEQVSILEENPEANLVYGPTVYWNSWTRRPRDLGRDRVSSIGVAANTLVRPPEMLTRMLIQDAARREPISPYTCSVLFRRSAFEEVGGFEENFLSLYEDSVFFSKLLLRSPVFVSDKVWAKYRLHTDQLYSGSYQSALEAGEWHPVDPNPAEKAFLDWIKSYLKGSPLLTWRLQLTLWFCHLPYWAPQLPRFLKRCARVFRRLTANFVWRRELAPGSVRFGDFSRTDPIDAHYGHWRGLSPDRYLFENFVKSHKNAIKGQVLEFGDDIYARRYGASNSVVNVISFSVDGTSSDNVLTVADQSFDCIIVADFFEYIFDLDAAVAKLHAMLRPGGVALVALPGIAPLTASDSGLGDCWRFTPLSVRLLFQRYFGSQLQVESRGNAFLATALLHGLGTDDFAKNKFEINDEKYPLVVFVVAQK